jgi:hypothetical protein
LCLHLSNNLSVSKGKGEKEKQREEGVEEARQQQMSEFNEKIKYYSLGHANVSL